MNASPTTFNVTFETVSAEHVRVLVNSQHVGNVKIKLRRVETNPRYDQGQEATFLLFRCSDEAFGMRLCRTNYENPAKPVIEYDLARLVSHHAVRCYIAPAAARQAA